MSMIKKFGLLLFPLAVFCLSGASDVHAQSFIQPTLDNDYFNIASSTSALNTCESVLPPASYNADRFLVSSTSVQELTNLPVGFNAYGGQDCEDWDYDYRTLTQLSSNSGITPIEDHVYYFYLTSDSNLTGADDNITDIDLVLYIPILYQDSQWQIFASSDDLPLDENWIVLDLTTEPQNIGYSANINGRLNFPDKTAGTISYSISFVSQTGLDYSSDQIDATTTATSTTFTHAVTFEQDDIVYAKAYLYDNSNWNATGLTDISREYEYWISANANPTQAIDLGVFRTGTTTFCGESGGALDFAWGTCMAMRVLFVPNEASLSYIENQLATATQTAPFAYIYDVNTYMDTLFTASSTVWSVATPSTTPVMGEITLISSADIDADSNFQIVRTAMGYMLLIGLPLYAFRRIKRISQSL